MEMSCLFNDTQRFYVKEGEKLSLTLREKLKAAFGISGAEAEAFRHHYIYSPPGAGKTFTTKAVAKEYGIDYLLINGHTTPVSLLGRIAAFLYTNHQGGTVVIDDSDSIFLTTDGLNMMKGALDNERNAMAWNSRGWQGYITQLRNADTEASVLEADALTSFLVPGGGIEVPTENMRFVIISNRRLATEEEAILKPKLMHEAAIRDRVICTDFELEWQTNWGWIAHVMLSNDVLGDKNKLSSDQRYILLDWVYTNWDRMSSHSNREMQRRAADMLNFPTDFKSKWEMSLRPAKTKK